MTEDQEDAIAARAIEAFENVAKCYIRGAGFVRAFP